MEATDVLKKVCNAAKLQVVNSIHAIVVALLLPMKECESLQIDTSEMEANIGCDLEFNMVLL